MPAVELTHLRAQIQQLSTRFHDPAAFRTALRDLLDQYANHAYRAGQAVKSQPLLPSYRISPLVAQQLELAFGKLSRERPVQALAVVEALWQDTHLEPRLLAASMLGSIPVEQAASVVAKLQSWATPDQQFRMLEALFKNGTSTLRANAPDLLLDQIDTWLNSSQTAVQALGLQALIPLADDPTYENVPPLFRLISPLVQSAPAPLQTDLLVLLQALAKRTPAETAYFLRQTLSLADGPATARLVRRCLPVFPVEQQAGLRAALQSVPPR